MLETERAEWVEKHQEAFQSNLGALEGIHLKYLEEIRELNQNLNAFRSQKEKEVS